MKNILIAFLLILFFATSCKQNTEECSVDINFCSTVDNGNIQETNEIINSFLSTLEYNYNFDIANNHLFNLNLLKAWLECNPCLNSAEIFCNSCIETLPVQSELKLILDNSETWTLDISMSKPFKSSFHSEPD